MRKLYLGSCIYLDGANRFRAVPQLEMEQAEARKAVVRNLFENFGLMSAENLSRFMKFELRMRDLRDILARLEDDQVLVKGFLVEGDDAVHWMLAADADKKIALPKDEFVLTPMDNLSYLLYPMIRERFGTWQYVVFQGTEMLGAFKGRKKGKDLYVFEIVGGQGGQAHHGRGHPPAEHDHTRRTDRRNAGVGAAGVLREDPPRRGLDYFSTFLFQIPAAFSFSSIRSATFLPESSMPPKIGPMRGAPITALQAMPVTKRPGYTSMVFSTVIISPISAHMLFSPSIFPVGVLSLPTFLTTTCTTSAG